MPAPEPEAKLRWEGGVPVSARHGDPYYSRTDGLAEARHVFLRGNRLAQRFAGAETFRIAELGFGTGLNFLAALTLWRAQAAPGAVLDYTAFERWPLAGADMARALGRWPELAGPAREFLAAWPGAEIALPGVLLRLVEGDARDTAPTSAGSADAWFLDGFAPAKNPEMWEAPLLATVHAKTVPGGSFATYSAAGHVRRALAAAGFSVERLPGYGSKREMLAGWRPAPGQAREGNEHGNHAADGR